MSRNPKLLFSAAWVGAAWVLDAGSLKLFLDKVGFKSIDTLMKEMAKYGRFDPHPELDKKLCPAFSFDLVFENCQGHETLVFSHRGDELNKLNSASIVALSLKKASNKGANLTVRATASWSGVGLADGIKPDWLTSETIPSIPNKALREAIEGVRDNWTDIPCINLNYDVFPDNDELSPGSVEETSLSCKIMP